VALDGALGEHELCGDVPIGERLCDEGGDLAFARCEGILRTSGREVSA
jgi:hypothetical protein